MLKYSVEDYVMSVMSATIKDKIHDLDNASVMTKYCTDIMSFSHTFHRLMQEIDKEVTQHGDLTSVVKDPTRKAH